MKMLRKVRMGTKNQIRARHLKMLMIKKIMVKKMMKIKVKVRMEIRVSE